MIFSGAKINALGSQISCKCQCYLAMGRFYSTHSFVGDKGNKFDERDNLNLEFETAIFFTLS